METEKVNTTDTSDSQFFAYLMAKGIKPIHHEIRNDHVCWTFIETPEIEKERADFYNNCASVDPQTYCDYLRKVKIIIREIQRKRR
jgi:hypothetical protein